MSFDPKIVGDAAGPALPGDDEALGQALSREAAMLAARYPGRPSEIHPVRRSGGRWLAGLLALATCMAVVTSAGWFWQYRQQSNDASLPVATPEIESSPAAAPPALHPPTAAASPVPPAGSLPPAAESGAADEHRLERMEEELEFQRGEIERLEGDLRRLERRLPAE